MKYIFIVFFLIVAVNSYAINTTNILCLEEDGETCTADNGRSAVHPDFFYTPAGVCGYKAWLFYTKWPSNPDEDLMLRRSNDFITWDADTNYTNPILENVAEGMDFYADPDVLYIDEYEDILIFSSPNYSNESVITLHVIDVDDAGCATIAADDYGGTAPNGNTSPTLISGIDSGGRSGETDDQGGLSVIAYPTAVFKPGTDRDTWTDDWIWIAYGEGTDDLGSTGSGQNTGWMFAAKFQYNPNDKSVNNFQRYTGAYTGGAIAEWTSDDTGFTCHDGAGHYDIVYDPYSNHYIMLYLCHPQAGPVSGQGYYVGRETSSDFFDWTDPGDDRSIRIGTGSFDNDTTEDAGGGYRSGWLHDGQGNLVRMTATVELNDFNRLAIMNSFNGTWTAAEGFHFHLVNEDSKSSGAAGFTAGFPRLRGGVNIP